MQDFSQNLNGALERPTEIFIVDDSRTQLEMLRYVLERNGFMVRSALNGVEALQALRKEGAPRPALIISDIVMPEMDGYEMCREVKKDPAFQDIPVILLTQLSEPEDIVAGLKSRADYYLTKPYQADHLLEKVRSVLAAPLAPIGEVSGMPAQGLEMTIGGKSFVVTAGPRQMLTLLFSTYENAVQQNRQLQSVQQDLKITNEKMTEQMRLLEEARVELEDKQTALLEANARLEELSTTDGMTGLKNHRAFKEKLEECFQHATRYKAEPLSVVLMDVDRFKQYNDSFGHPAGDVILRQFAAVLQQMMRATDFAARYGGEEFVAILPHTEKEGAQVLIERLRLAIENAPWPGRPITASFGIATSGEKHDDSAALVSAADRALYFSKQNGRNRWSHSDDVAA